ncbi:MAG: ASKHA domain-containing protein [Pseudomonadota bacterium]
MESDAIRGWAAVVSVPAPSLKDNTADTERLVRALKPIAGDAPVVVDLAVQRRLPQLLRSGGRPLRCVFFKEPGRWVVVDAATADSGPAPIGLAIDLGTTRVVMRLVDLVSGKALGEITFDNPQIRIGPDILTRIHYTDTPGGLEELHRIIIEAIGRAAGALCDGAGRRSTEIQLVAVAGNTAMSHLFLRLDPHWMIREPYIPVVNRPGVVAAADLGLPFSPGARVLVFPNIGSYFGGDVVAGILYSGLYRREETAVLVDVGTNAEVVLGSRHWLIACAGAAGPALEGGAARMGMMAGEGVIDRVRIDPKTGAFHFSTIGGMPPRGICGSGLIDLAAQLFGAGMLDIRGKLVPARCGDRFLDTDGLGHLVVVPAGESATAGDLTISQADLDSLIRSKAAMYTILETIHQSVGMDMAELDAFLVAGTFGAFIDPVSAITIGMLPDLPLSKYHSIGNSSLEGAVMALLSRDSADALDTIRSRITYLELNVNQDFMNRFSAAKFIPHTDTGRFPSVRHPGAVMP